MAGGMLAARHEDCTDEAGQIAFAHCSPRRPEANRHCRIQKSSFEGGIEPTRAPAVSEETQY